MTNSALKFTGFLIAFSILGCGDSTPPQNLNVIQEDVKSTHGFDVTLFETNRARWLSSNIRDYSIDIDATGFIKPFLPAVIEVRNSKFVSIEAAEPNKNKHWVDSYKSLKLSTVDEIFAFIETQAKQKPDILDVVYDDRYGFPVSIILDQKKGWADDDLSVSITNFQVSE